jgi:hypothetical protein
MEERSCTEGGGRGRRGAAQKGRRRGEVEEGEGGQEAYRRGSCLVAAAMWYALDFLPSPARFPPLSRSIPPLPCSIPPLSRSISLPSRSIPFSLHRYAPISSIPTDSLPKIPLICPGRAEFLGDAARRPLLCAPTISRRLGVEKATTREQSI